MPTSEPIGPAYQRRVTTPPRPATRVWCGPARSQPGHDDLVTLGQPPGGYLQSVHMHSPTGHRLPIAAAAEALGVSEKTIRRRIKAGTIAAARVVTPQGHVWLVDVGTARPGSLGRGVLVNDPDRRAAIAELTRTVAEQVTRSLSTRIEELTRENEQLRARLQSLEVSKGPSSTKDPAPGPGSAFGRAGRAWWRFWERAPASPAAGGQPSIALRLAQRRLADQARPSRA